MELKLTILALFFFVFIVEIKADPVECATCTSLLNLIENQVSSSMTDEEIYKLFDNACVTFGSLTNLCELLKDSLREPNVIQWIRFLSPNEICEEVWYCPIEFF
eukprot:TRINITY_DN7640_c0_g1_i1.p1 TRINITY_DN7640_c0_g1~~TRINITY_DN7640_c0_g1_i1.p1  ORF type:complete len:104 (-),score=12.64 TRINITY_DN7640_c0_g1_i1:52-363(-)